MYVLKQEFHPGNEVRQILYAASTSRRDGSERKDYSPENDKSAEVDSCCVGSDEAPPAERQSSSVSPLLDSCSYFGESPKRRQRRHYGISLEGKRKVQRAVAVMDELYSPEQLLFLTGTVPGGGREVELAIASEAPFIVHRLKDWLNYYSGCPHEVWVWELQKRGMPHLHMVTAISDAQRRQQVIERFHSEWCSILEAVCERTGVDVFRQGFGKRLRHQHRYVQADVAPVRKSVARYMSKYLSKDVSHKRQCPIPRWYGVSRPLSAEVKSRTYVVETAYSDYKTASQKFSEIAEDIKGLSALHYAYGHKVGIGATAVFYPYGPSVYNLILQEYVMACVYDRLPELVRHQLRSSLCMTLMMEYQENLKRYAVGRELSERTKSAFDSLPANEESVLRSGTRAIRNWRKRLLLITAEITPQKVQSGMSLYSFDRHCRILRAMWDVEEDMLDYNRPMLQSINAHSMRLKSRMSERVIFTGVGSLDKAECLAQVQDVLEQLQLEIPFEKYPTGDYRP